MSRLKTALSATGLEGERTDRPGRAYGPDRGYQHQATYVAKQVEAFVGSRVVRIEARQRILALSWGRRPAGNDGWADLARVTGGYFQGSQADPEAVPGLAWTAGMRSTRIPGCIKFKDTRGTVTGRT